MKVGLMLCKRNCCSSKFRRQEEGLDYDEVFAPMATIEAIRIFLAFASYMGFIVYQMNVKSAFLYGTIDEEALYGLHQALGAWYATLSTFLKRSGYRRGAIDKTLCIKQDKKDIMLVQVYVKQKEDGIFISQDKYVAEILKKFDFLSVKTASTPIETQKPLVKDEETANVDVHLYRSMIGSLMYLTASRPNIMFAVCACSRFQVTPKTSHLQAVKRIFRYLKGQLKLGLWYPKVSSSNLEAYSDSDYAGANLDRKSTTEAALLKGRLLEVTTAKQRGYIVFSQNDDIFTGLANMGYETMSDKLTFYKAFFSPQWKFLIHTILQCLSAKTTSWNEFSSTMALAIICLATNQKFSFSRYILLSLVKNIKAGVPFYMFPRFVQLVVDHRLGDISHHQDIYDNPSLTKKVFANMKRVGTGFSRVITPLFESMWVPVAEKVEHHIPSPSNDPIPDADKDSLTLLELVDFCKTLSNKFLDLKSKVIDLKSSFTHKITKLEDRVHKLEEENKILKEASFKSAKIDTAASVKDNDESFKQGRMIADLDADVEDTDEEEPAEIKEVLEVVKAAKLMTKDNAVMRYQALKRKPMTEAQARKNTMNFNKEDLEALWKIVKERFETTGPKNFSDDFLLNTLKIMFEKPNVEANVWRD
nr:hypothetical protein [Tanacetum cinerariifolium]